MNKRLNELAEQAFNEYESVYKYEANIPREFTEKFAEFIVMECIKLNGKELAMSGHSRMITVYCENFGIKF